MGVGGLFGFLRRRYPAIVEEIAQQPRSGEGEGGAADDGGSGSDDEGVAGGCDALYVDLNHVLHACTHPSWRDVPHASELESFQEVEDYLCRIVGLARCALRGGGGGHTGTAHQASRAPFR